MKTLTLENICPYMPYELKIANKDLKGNIVSVYEIEIENNNDKGILNVINGINQIPILRPMNLTTPIQVDGKEIIPIVELAKIAFEGIDFENWLQGDKAISKEIEKHKRIRFWYLKKEYSFHTTLCGKQHIPNQLALFQWLAKHKFDYMNLIHEKLEIDVNTLDVNPYNS